MSPYALETKLILTIFTAEEVGQYQLVFDDTCQTTTFELLDDPCVERAEFFNGMTLFAANPVEMPQIVGPLGIMRNIEAAPGPVNGGPTPSPTDAQQVGGDILTVPSGRGLWRRK